MNKTVLIIICDFLLISILAMVEFKPNVEIDAVDEQALRDQAAEEMLELLQLSLEHESAQREDIEETLESTLENLDETQENLQATELTLNEVSASLEQTAEEKAAIEEQSRQLADNLAQTQLTLALTREEREQLEQSLNENERQAQRLQEELREEQQRAMEKDSALIAAQETLDRLESSEQLLQTQLEIRDTEKALLQENLVAAKAEVERARVEAERAQLRTESLAAGVSELAASSSALKEEIRQTQPLSLNAIYRSFEDNRVFIRFQWTERNFLGSNQRESALQSVLISTEEGFRAVFATGNTPLLELAGRENTILATITIGGRTFAVKDIGFLDGDRAIAAIRIPERVIEETGITTFAVSTDPLRFSSAVLVKDDQELYGEIPVRVPPGDPSSLEIESRLFNRLFGEFSPSAGDYVFSMTGEIIGIMTQTNRARMLQEPEFVDFRTMGSSE